VSDPSKYAIASIVIQDSHGPYTISNQPPITNVPYPDSFASKQLPGAGSGGPLNHLMDNGDATIAETMAVVGSYTLIASPGGEAGYNHPLYYAVATDPVYMLTGLTGGIAIWNGVNFHAPSQAVYSGSCYGVSAGCGGFDSVIHIWDQPNGTLLGFHLGNSSDYPRLPACPAGGHAGTDADPCPFTPSGNYVSYQNRSSGSGYAGGDASSSNSMPPEAGTIRMKELMAGKINHAVYLDTLCTDTANGGSANPVFPADQKFGGTAQTCAQRNANVCQPKKSQNSCASTVSCTWNGSQCNFDWTNRPPNGSLVFLDYEQSDLDCLNPAKTSCGGIAKLPLWQYPVIEALTMYGGYIGDTGNPGIYIGDIEGGDAAMYYGQYAAVAQPFYDWLAANCTTDPSQPCWYNSGAGVFPPASEQKFVTHFFMSIPNIRGAGIVSHMHIADPCVAEGLAGISGGCQ
jgi:hypothetical protein